jgi:hypothetical protein
MKLYLHNPGIPVDQQEIKKALDRYSRSQHKPDKPREKLNTAVVVSTRKGRKRWSPPRR